MASRKSRRRRKNRNAALLITALVTLLIAVGALIVIMMKQETPAVEMPPAVYTAYTGENEVTAEPEPLAAEETPAVGPETEEPLAVAPGDETESAADTAENAAEKPSTDGSDAAEEPSTDGSDDEEAEPEEIAVPAEPVIETADAIIETPAPVSTPGPVSEPTAEPTPEPTAVPTPQPTPVAVKYPYKIVVNKGAQIVGIFTIDENGEYTIPVKYMICSTGKTDKLKNGNYKLKGSDNRYEWRQMFSGVWVHYATRISGNFLFHSLSYNKSKSNTLIADTYKALGTKASDGCVRLMVKDAKWIYDNCPAGTRVQVITGSEQPEIMETIVVPELVSGKWDPTDPNPNNPDYFAEPDATPEPTRCPWVTPVPNDFKWSEELRSGRQK